MNLEPTDEQVALRDTVRRFLADRASIADHVRPLLDDPTGTTEPVWRELAELGATGVLVPEEYGGAGMTMVEAGVVAEELGAALHPGPWLSTAVASVRALTRVGDTNLLAGIAEGSMIATLALDAAATAGTSLSGELTAVPDAAAATVLLVPADGALWAVDAADPGVTVTRREHVDPTRKLFDVSLSAAHARRLGDASDELIDAITDDVLIASAADALGAATTVLNLAIGYARVRAQFGAPIGSFQAVQHLCVDMYETVELARGGVLHALWAADHAQSDERRLTALRAKGFSARLATVGDTAIQVFGGIGFTWEHDAHLYLKRLLGWATLRGGSDGYLEAVGRRLATRCSVEQREGT